MKNCHVLSLLLAVCLSILAAGFAVASPDELSVDGIRLRMTPAEVEALLGKPRDKGVITQTQSEAWEYSDHSSIAFQIIDKKMRVYRVMGVSLKKGNRLLFSQGDEVPVVAKGCRELGGMRTSKLIDPNEQILHYEVDSNPKARVLISFLRGKLILVSIEAISKTKDTQRADQGLHLVSQQE